MNSLREILGRERGRKREERQRERLLILAQICDMLRVSLSLCRWSSGERRGRGSGGGHKKKTEGEADRVSPDDPLTFCSLAGQESKKSGDRHHHTHKHHQTERERK
jgi:hypothetical protein